MSLASKFLGRSKTDEAHAKDIDAARARRLTLIEERHALAVIKGNRAEVRGRVDDMIARQAEVARKAAVATLQRMQGDASFVPTLDLLGTTTSQIAAQNVEVDAAPMFCLIAPDLVRSALLAGIASIDDAPDAAQRASRIAAIDNELHKLEVAEEKACRALDEANGTFTPRRVDADPAVLLGA